MASNQTDFRQPPDRLFLNPGQYSGIFALCEPDFLWRPHDRAVILGVPASADDEMNGRIGRFVSYTARHKTFAQAVEFNTIPVLLEGAEFRKSYVMANGRFVLSGASGIRLQNRYCWINRDAGEDAEAALADWFGMCASVNRRVMPVASSLPRDLPVAIDCRNTFNYYHFLTESLSQLGVLVNAGFTGPVRFHFPNHPDKTRAFAAGHARALFPEIADRIEFVRSPAAYDRVIAACTLNSAYFQYGDDLVPSIDHLVPSRAMWQGRAATRAAQGLLSMNAVDSALVALRNRALEAISGQDFSYLPRRFWVGREPGHARPRQMAGEDELFEMLSPFGFERIAFETLSPLEQIAIMANAEMMIAAHGAGFTNMLFAGPQTTVIELGTLQTAQFRWGDFWKLAHVAGCRYVSFFADYARDGSRGDPSFAVDGIVPVSLSRRGLAEVMALVVTLLGHLPRLNRREPLQRLAERLLHLGAADAALALLDAHRGAEKGHGALLLLRAECHRRLGQASDELAALRLAFAADPGRAQTLVQIVWCARKAQSPESVRWALSELHARFPDRHADLVRDRAWMRRLAC